MKKAVIVGATSGIGRELAIQLDREGYSVGITGRRKELLDSLAEELNNPSFLAEMDVFQTEQAQRQFNELVHFMGHIDLVVISAGTGHINPDLKWEQENETVQVNVQGFTAIAVAATKLFIKQKSGHLVGISSIGGLRGEPDAQAYNASKAYVSNYLEGLSKKMFKAKLPIAITDIQPGLVDTAMAKGEGLFWVMPVEKAVAQIITAIKRKKRIAVVTKRWNVIAGLLKTLPFSLYQYL